MTEDALESDGGAGARRAIGEARFDGTLRRELERRVGDTGVGDEDAAPRMRTEGVKAKPARVPGIRVDAGRGKGKGMGVRLANARDRASVYAALAEGGMTAEEREQYRREMKARFLPEGRSGPATVQGLASLANKRIEDAYARGQFKNLPRGSRIERDYNASSPFIDTTEYLLNKIIQKQEIVPPWIEKQQELVSTANKFRARLRNDWKRHAARSIASLGGSLAEQMSRAEEYARAEEVVNPRKKKEEKVNTVDGEGQVSQITMAGELKTTNVEGETAPQTEIQITKTPVSADAVPTAPASPPDTITITPAEAASTPTPISTSSSTTTPASAPDIPSTTTPTLPTHTTLPPFRDPLWQSTELPYLTAAIKSLNDLTRSYNLMAPTLAQKPYFNLDRELRSCFADVAPVLAAEIRDRALRPKARLSFEKVEHKPGSVLQKFSTDQRVRVHDEDLGRKGYGFGEFWRDLWAKG